MLSAKSKERIRSVIRLATGLSPVLMLALLLAGNLSMWRQTNTLSDDLTHNQSLNTAGQVTMRIENLLQERTNDLAILANLWASYPEAERVERFLADATGIIAQEPSYHVINYVDAQSIIRISAPLGKRPELVGLDLKTLPGREVLHQQVRENGIPIASPPIELTNGNPGTVIWHPVLRATEAPDVFEGMIAGTFHIDQIVQRAVTTSDLEEFRVEIKLEEAVVYNSEAAAGGGAQGPASGSGAARPGAARLEALGTTKDVSLLGQMWSVSVYPRPESSFASLPQDNLLRLRINIVLSLLAAGLLGLAVVATQRVHKGEQRLQQSKENYRLLVENQTDLIVKVDAQGKFQFVSPSYCAFFGKREDELLGQDFMPLVHKEDRAPTAQAMDALYQPPHTAYVEQRAMTQDGWRWLGWMDTALFDEEGELTAIIGVGRDITARKEAEVAREQALEKTARSQRLLMTLSHAAQSVQRSRSPEEVYRTIGEEISALGYEVTIFTVTEERSHLATSYMTFAPALLQTAEKLMGVSAQDYRFPLTPGGFYQRLIIEGTAVFSDPGALPITEALPKEARPLARQLARLLGVAKAIYVPLKIDGETESLMTVMGADLEEADVPAMTAFGSQAAIAVENAQLYRDSRQSERFLQDVFDAIQDGISVLDNNFQVLRTNRWMEQRYSTQRPLTGKVCHLVYQQRPSPCPWCPTLRTVETGETQTEIVPYPHADDPTGWIELSTFPIKDDHGQVLRVIEYVKDITERVQANAMLRENEQRFRKIFEEGPLGMAILSPDDRFVRANAALCRMTGYTEEELVNTTYLEITHPDDVKISKSQAELLLSGEIPYLQTEKRYLTKEGQTLWINLTASFIHDDDGRPRYKLTMIEDITERKRSEEERAQLAAQVRAQARQMEQILETVPAGVVLLDATGQVLQANPAAESELAILAGAAVGDTLTQLGNRPLVELLTSPPTKGLWHEVKGEGNTFEVIARPMEPTPASLAGEGGERRLEPENWVLVINDVTQERENQLRIQQQERLAAVGQLAAGIAHDFNNILAIISLHSQIGLRTPEQPEKLRKSLEITTQQTKRATHLVQQILDFSRSAVLEQHLLDLAPLLREMVGLLERTLPENIRIQLTSGPDEYVVNADPTRLQQAFMNLVVNARDAMPEGGVLRITLSLRPATSMTHCRICGQLIEGTWVQVAVTDTGTGISPSVLSHIFEPFFTTKEVGKGTGLGLAQVQGIVAQHEGHIDVVTKMGVGTTFTVYLPIFMAAPAEELLRDTPALHQGQGETILVVEDDDILREALVDSLGLLNYRVLSARNGREALDVLDRHAGEVALVLSDLVMPQMGGQALFYAIQQRGLALPVVMLSGHPMESELKSLQAQGLAGWMLKPPDIVQLSQLLAQTLQE